MQRAREHAAQVDQLRNQAESAEARLREEVARYRADHDAVQQSLKFSQDESERLRTAALAAQQRIDAVLMRLPGAPQE